MPTVSVKRRLFDLILVLVLTIGPVILLSITAARFTPNYDHSLVSLRLLHRTLFFGTSLALVAYVLFSQGRTVRDIGLTFRWRDIAFAIGLAAIAWGAVYAYNYLRLFFWQGGEMVMSSGLATVITSRITVLLLLSIVVSAAFEELIVRGYLMTEIMNFLGSKWMAIVISVALQASYHSYQGNYQLGVKLVGFLPFAIYFAYTRRLAPVVLAHVLINVWIVGASGRL